MPSLLACLGCGGRGESDDITTLDYTHASLTDVPADVFACERTLEELYLDSNQLRELPRQLFYCHGLRVLGLSDNELTALPPAVASLINLTNIDLSKNAISDIPDNIKGCRHLAVVDASINPLCRLPEGFTQLPTLTELYLNDTFLEYLPASFGRLSRLRILELRENQLNTLPKTIIRLTNLQRLDIGQNDFSELPEVIGSLGNLTELWFDNNKVKSLPPLLGRLRKLEHVDASKNKVDWVAAEIESCTALTDLHLSSNHLKELPEKLGGCRQLQVLKLDDNALTHLPESIGGLAALQELVVTQNDLETLPASMGLLRNLHTLHLDDNLLTELPPELGSCSNLTVLTAASNRLTSVPAELGHLPHLAVLNLCDNLIPYLPVSLTKLKLRALWLSENQNKPQVQLQSETLPETGQRVLTCFMLPQQPRNHQPETVVEADTFPGQGWDEQRRAKTLIKFAFDGDVDKPGRLTRAPTPYPKELKALAKHARNLHSLQKDPTAAAGRQFVMPKTQDSAKKTTTPASSLSASVTQPGKGEASETDLARKTIPIDPSVPPHILDNGRKREDKHMEEDDEDEDGEGPSPPLAVMELPAEERPLLREARNVRNSHLTPSTSSTTGAPEGGERMINGTGRKAGTALAGDQSYAIGDRKVFGLAQVVTTSPPTQDKAPPSEPGKGGETTPPPPPPTTAPPPMTTPTQEAPTSAYDGDTSSDPQDKRIKKPPPYHIAAVMSRHASDFGGEGAMVEGAAVPASISRPGQGTAIGPTSPLSPGAAAAAAAGGVGGEDETNDTTSSSSDSGYGNGKASTQPSDDQVCSERSSLNTPSSPHNLTDSAYSMPSTPSSPPGNLNLASPQSSSRSFMSSLSTASHRPSSLSVPPMATSLPSHTSPSSPYSPSTTSYSPPYSSSANNASQRLFPTQHPPHSHAAKPSARPASIATGTQLEPSNGAPAQRPGSLALGALADSALLNRLPHDHRPGSLAAPINTLGIPPPPARAVSHMGLNMASPSRPIDHSMFRSQDLTRTSNGGLDHRGSNHRQESNGLVSIIDQVTSSLLEHGDSPPPKTLPSDMTSPSTPLQANSTGSMGYSQPGMVVGGGKDQQPPPVTVSASSSASHSYHTTTNNFTATSRSVGPTNFTQDQPRGEVLHPTPHRPNLLSPSNSRPSNDILQDSTSVDDHEGGQSGNDLNNSHSEASLGPQKSTSKLPSRIPAPRSSSEAAYGGLKGPHKDPHSPSQSATPHTDTRIPTNSPAAATTHDNTRHSPNSLTGEPQSQLHAPSRLQTPGSIARSPGVTQEHKLTPDSKIPSLNSNTHSHDRPGPESRIPTLGNIGRSPSGLTKDIQSPPQESQKPVDYRSANEQGESRIPMMGMSGHTPTESYSKGTRPSPGDTPRGYNSSHSRTLITGQQAGGGGASGIPTLASQGRSNSGLGTNHPGPGGLTGKTHPSTPSYGFSKMPTTPTSTRSEGSQMHQSKLQSPTYSSGIRPPSIHPTQSPPSQQPQPQQQSQPQTPRGYSSGIRPPAINSAINTPGIPIPSPLVTPGSRGSVTSTGSASRIPHAAGLSSKIPAPGGSKHRVSPSSASPTAQQQPLDTTKVNHHHSAWMFGQHKNVRVVCHNFPVMIEKNPDLGFTIGQSSADPDDKSIYVMSVAGGGAASSALKVGDKLLQVDGVDLRQADLHKATAILHNTHSTVSLMVSRLQ